MIVHVPEIGLGLGTDARNIQVGQLSADVRHPGEHVLKMDGLASQAKQAGNLARSRSASCRCCSIESTSSTTICTTG